MEQKITATLFGLLTVFLLTVLAQEYSVERIQVLKEDTLIDFKLRAHRLNRTCQVIIGNATLLPPLTVNPEQYFVEVKSFRSRTGNSEFSKLPFFIPKTDFCNFMNTKYRQFIMNSVKPPASDAPYTDDPNESLCEMIRTEEEEKYIAHFRHVMIDFSTLPKIITQPGFYKLVFDYTGEIGENINTVFLYFKIYEMI